MDLLWYSLFLLLVKLHWIDLLQFNLITGVRLHPSGVESNQFDLGSICGPVSTRVVHITQLLVWSSSIWFDSIRVLQSEVVPLEVKQFDSIRIYTMSATKLIRIDSNWHASVNRLLVCWCVHIQNTLTVGKNHWAFTVYMVACCYWSPLWRCTALFVLTTFSSVHGSKF